MRNILLYMIHEFGFTSWKSLFTSLFAPKYGVLFITLSGIGSFGEFFFGMSNITLVILAVLVSLELVTGIWSARVRKKKIVSKKLQRFILKMFIYFFFIMMFNILCRETKGLTKNVYCYMHSFTILYFVFVHFKSIAENYNRIAGKKGTDFSEIIKQFASKVFGTKDKTKDEE